MVRRRERPASAVDAEDVPRLELLRCPWTRWNDQQDERFEDWLRQRQKWRETHADPLPGLFARDRFALHRLEEGGRLDPAVVRAERSAPQAEPEWRQRQLAGRPPQVPDEE